MLFLGWRKTPIKLVCGVLPSPGATIPSTSGEPLKQFLEPTVPPKLWPLRRTKRFFKDPYRHNHLYPRYHYRPYIPCFYTSQFPIATTTAPPIATTKTPLLNPDIWRRLLHRVTAHDQNTSPQNAIDHYVQPSQDDWRKLRKMAQQAILQNYMHKALGFHPHVHPLSNVISKSPLLNPKPCRRRWYDGSCLDAPKLVRKTLNFPLLSSLSFKNKYRNDWQPVYSMNQKSDVIWDQLPWFQN